MLCLNVNAMKTIYAIAVLATFATFCALVGCSGTSLDEGEAGAENEHCNHPFQGAVPAA
jgi:tetrahydromethanopterin S-methyltransferase subunit E